jgi:hypothetical protein
MYTSVTLAALVAALTGSSMQAGPRWHRDYYQARGQAKQEGKPLAVFVGSGWQGYTQLSRERRLSPQTQRLLAANYVCMYADTKSHTGRGLANELAIRQERGVVLSDRTGALQAFYHDGDLDDADLNRYLRRFADPNLVVQRTVTNPTEPGSYSLPSPAPAPAFYAPAFGGFGGGRSC